MDSPKAAAAAAGAEESPSVERYSCSRCKFHTTSKRQLQHHIRHRHSPGKYVCQECGEKFNRALMYKLHITTHTNKGEHACPTCNKTFPLVSMLKIHQDTHSTESIHPCPHCSKQFRQKSALSKHVAFGHTKKNIHPCTVCGKILPSPSALVLHMDAHKSSSEKTAIDGSAILSRRLRFFHRPNDQNMFRCQRCNRKFFTSYALAKHMEGHHGLQNYKCIECKLDFKTKKALYRHTAEHVHECDECGKKFRSQEQLDTHKKLHTKCELVCAQCGRHFSKGTSYRRHMESHAHNPKYQCPECGKNFRRQADLNMHQELHKGDGFPCEDCGKAFGTKQHLIWHSYIHYSAKMAVKQEKSESDVTADVNEETTEPEMKKEPLSASECGTPRKQTKKDLSKKSKSASKKDAAEEKDKRKEKTRTPSPAKKSSAASSAKTPNSKKKATANDKTPHGEREVKIKEEKVEENKSKNASKSSNATPSKSGSASPSKSGNTSPSKSGNASTSKSARSAKKAHRRRSKARRKSRKSNSTGSGEPTPTDTDSKGVTETESVTDTQSEKLQSDKMMSTEEVLLSDDVLQDSNELHDAKELQVDHVMFDDNEDDVELDIDAAIETLTKLGSHTEHEVTTEAFDEVGIDEDLNQQTVKDMTVEDEIVGLEDMANIEAADKEMGNVDIQTLYDMETDNETAAEVEVATAKAAAGVFSAMQDSAVADLQAVAEAEQVMSDSSAAMLIESEIVQQADRLIQTGLYVQNVMGAQDCNTVLEALNSAVQNEALNVGQNMMETQQGDKDELASSNLIQSLLEKMNASGVEMSMVPTGTAEQADDMMAAATTEANNAMLQEGATLAEATAPLLTVQAVTGDKSSLMEQADGVESVAEPEQVTTHNTEVPKSAVGESGLVENKSIDSQKDQQQEKCPSPKDVSDCKENNEDPSVNDDAEEKQAKSASTSYAAAFEMFVRNNEPETLVAAPGATASPAAVAADSGAQRAQCGHADGEGEGLDSHRPCIGGCAKCSTEFGLSINKTVCPHSKELKVLIEKLDMKDCPVGDNGEVMLAVAKAAEASPALKRKRTTSTELGSLLGGKDLYDVLPEGSPSKSIVGMSRLRRRIRHASGDSKSVSTKICDTRRRESQPSIDPLVTPPELGSVSPRVSTRSSNARVSRPMRTSQPYKEWRKPSPPTEKKHTKKFLSVPRRKSDSDQMSPPPQYKVSTLNDLTIRITTQSSPETSPPQQKKSPAFKDGGMKGSRAVEKEDGALRQTHGATQELCVVLDDINELVLLQQERLQKLKGFRPVKVGKRAEEKRRHKSSELPSEIDVPQKPIKILLRLPKDRIKKHERRLAALDRRMNHGTPDAETNGTREYPQPDSSQDMHRDKSRSKTHDGNTGHRQRGTHVNDTVVTNHKDTASSAGSPEEPPIEDWQGEGVETRRIIGSVISLNSSVLSVEECDSTSMAETQRQASSTISSPGGETSRRKSGSRRKETSPSKGGSPTGQSHMVVEPLDLTVKYKELSDTEVKPDPDQAADESMEAAEYCECDDDTHNHSSSHSCSPAIKTEDEREDSSQSAGASMGSCTESVPPEHGSSSHLALGDDAPQGVAGPTDGPETGDFVSEEGADGPVTEFIEVIDRGIQCELGDELLFMPDAPQQAVD